MKMNSIIRLLTVLLVVSVVFLCGCINYLAPTQGAMALEKSRVDLPEAGLKEVTWKGKDLDIQYSISRAGGQLAIFGKIMIHDSVIMSYPRMNRLVVRINFLNESGTVIGAADITPSYSVSYEVDGPFSFKGAVGSVPGISSFAFNYFGTFVGVPHEAGESLDIFYFPFE